MPSKHRLCRVTGFEAVAPYTLRVEFDDKTVQVIDFEPILAGQIYGPLRDQAVFDQVSLDPEVHTLVWPTGADFDPATLHDWPEHLASLKTMATRWAKMELDDEWIAARQAQAALARFGPFETLASISKAEGVPLSTLAQAAREQRMPAVAIPGGWLARRTAVQQRIGLQSGRGRPRKPKGKAPAQPKPAASAKAVRRAVR
jgi:hypothetical protein